MKRLTKININTPERYNENHSKNMLDKVIDISSTDEEKKKREALADNVDYGMKVVELGCGNSDLLSYVKEKYPDCEVYGLDFSEVVVKEMNEQFPDIYYKVGDALKTPYQDNYFDVVMAGELIEHMENPDDLVKEMSRICKENGTISVSTPFRETTWRHEVPKEHIWEFDRQDMIDIFSKYGKPEIKLFIGSKAHIVVNCELGKTSDNPYIKYKKLRTEKQIISSKLKGIDFDSILEVGCQWGENLKVIKEKYPDKKVIGIDINKYVLEEAKNYLDGIELKQGDINKLDIPDNSVDIVFTEALFCMLNFNEVEIGLKELIRVAKKHIFLVELDTYSEMDLVGLRTGVNWIELFKKLGLKATKRKLDKKEWGVGPWLSNGYLISVKL